MTDSKPESASEEAANLRARVDQLADPVAPAVATATDKVRGQAQQAKATFSEQTEQLAQLTRQSPLSAVLIACITGYMVGRIVR